jgi:hypothetical protein
MPVTILPFVEVVNRISNVEAVALTLCHENGYQNDDARLDRLYIATVISNRVWNRYRGSTPKEVVLARRQFSCWNHDPNDQNHMNLLARASRWLSGTHTNDSLEQHAFWLARSVEEGWLRGVLHRMVHHYHAKRMKLGYPNWSEGQTPVVATRYHLFYKGIA